MLEIGWIEALQTRHFLVACFVDTCFARTVALTCLLVYYCVGWTCCQTALSKKLPKLVHFVGKACGWLFDDAPAIRQVKFVITLRASVVAITHLTCCFTTSNNCLPLETHSELNQLLAVISIWTGIQTPTILHVLCLIALQTVRTVCADETSCWTTVTATVAFSKYL